MKKLLAARSYTTPTEVALLLVRVVGGLAMVLHGWPKIQDPMGWMGPDAFAPGFMLALAAVAEFGGGIAWIVGLLTPIATFGIACTMGVAVYMHAIMNGDPFVARGASYELAAVYLAVSLLILAMGPGRLSFDRAVFGER
ncbi:Inner membrane protein YqjF [Planctomycetes bacterium Pla163]|uniref:Inner membrane protein YqjF n=1 Tax=Rohdeia mirabilis TaxID=2528008 RepID=A0A518CUR6_9BACT|nr:Inner membrane protein YqjF [Planctomycetes bacterium Pla163]